MQDKIVWETIKPQTIDATYDENIVNFIYNTKIGDKYFWLYKYKAKYFRDEYDWDWTEKIKFEMIDETYNSLYEFPYDYSLVDLYNAIREKTSGISELLDDLLSI
ncbi:hypothetical protein [Flavobacterium sp.]|uniref:hypothetical protein n=1 Tax=Flavobacterium sp. TaxID=239 RepID=UPI003C5B685F